MTQPLDDLIHALARLPGMGRRSAERAALALARRPDDLLDGLSAALAAARAALRCCDLCGGFTTVDSNPCRLCTDPARDDGLLCIVEEPGDIMAMERSGVFNGRYHALLGKVSPSRQTGPGALRLKKLVERVAAGGVREVVIAISTDMEGDATAVLIRDILKDHGVRVSRLAFGLPADSGIGYADPLTLKRALTGRIDA